MAGKHSRSFFDLKNIKLNKPKFFNKKPTKTSILFVATTSLLILSLVISFVFVSVFFVSGKNQKALLEQAAESFNNFGATAAIETYSAENKDVKGWLCIEDTSINYAVCHSDSDVYYNNHNFLGKKSRYGALFLSPRDSFSRKGNDKNIVIFGNNVNDGSMFGCLKKYRNLNFYKQNPCIDLYYNDTKEKYIIFSVMLISSHSDDSGELYAPFKSYFSDQDVFNDWLAETRNRSIVKTPVAVEYGDDILTLVTTANDFENARLVVMAKKITEWDASHTDVSTATINAKAKYPKIWYTSRGLEYPY